MMEIQQITVTSRNKNKVAIFKPRLIVDHKNRVDEIRNKTRDYFEELFPDVGVNIVWRIKE